MKDIAIRVENLGKQYKACPARRKVRSRRVGRLLKRNDTLRDMIAELGKRIADFGT
jgi:hypothetical protein